VFKDKKNQGKQIVLLIGKRRIVEEVNGGNNSTFKFRKHKPKPKGHPHLWRDGTQPS